MGFRPEVARLSTEAWVFDKDGVNKLRTMDAANQDLFDVSGSTGAGNENDRAARHGLAGVGWHGKALQDLFQRGSSLTAAVESDMDWRGERR